MLNLGLIGDIPLLEKFTHRAQEHPEIHITGKSSVGTQPKPGSFRLQAPEFNRIELIERSDILFISRFSLLPFDLLCDMVKKSKHFFAASYPDLTPAEISQLIKLAHEAKTVIQVSNPFYYLPGMQTLTNHLKRPAYTDVTFFTDEAPGKEALLQLLLMLKDVIGGIPKKVTAVSFRSKPAEASFQNVQLEFGDGSVVSLSFGKRKNHPRFKINSYMRDAFTELDLNQGTLLLNNRPEAPSKGKAMDETSAFIEAVVQKRKAATDLETYATSLLIQNLITEKLERYSSF